MSTSDATSTIDPINVVTVEPLDRWAEFQSNRRVWDDPHAHPVPRKQRPRKDELYEVVLVLLP